MNATVHWPALHADHFRSSRVLVTGGAGFIGSHLVEALVHLVASVVVLDDLSGGSTDNLAPFAPVEFVRGSVLDPAVVGRCTQGCRFVFHQAALGSVPASVREPRLYHDVNTTGTLNVLEAAREAGVERVMFAASASAYGDNPVPWVENQPVQAKSPYAANKVAGEALMIAYAANYPLDTAPLRYFNVFGPRQNANSAYAAAIAAFAKAFFAGQRPTIFGDGEQTRDFIFVRNVVHANLLAARHPGRIGGQVINVGCGGRISVNGLVRLMARAIGREDLVPLHAPERAGDLKHSYADIGRARAELGFEPIVDFEAGLRETLEWYASDPEQAVSTGRHPAGFKNEQRGLGANGPFKQR